MAANLHFIWHTNPFLYALLLHTILRTLVLLLLYKPTLNLVERIQKFDF